MIDYERASSDSKIGFRSVSTSSTMSTNSTVSLSSTTSASSSVSSSNGGYKISIQTKMLPPKQILLKT